MRSDKGKAFVLRSEGKSYREIASLLGVSKGTLSGWFQGVDFSTAIKTKLTKQAAHKNRAHMQQLNRTRGAALEVQYALAVQEAAQEAQRYRVLPLFSAGIGLYAAQGDRRSPHHIRLRSADPAVLRVWCAFLQQLCSIPAAQLSLALSLPPTADEAACKRYWLQHTNVSAFHKTQRTAGAGTGTHSSYGTCTVVTTNSYTKKKIQVWIDQLPEMVLNTVPQQK